MFDALARLGDQLVTLLTDPVSNLPAALLLYGILGGLLLILLLGAIMFLMGVSDDEDEDLETEGQPSPKVDRPRLPKAVAVPSVPSPRRRALTAAIVVAVVAAAFVLAGVTTSTNSVCLSCHADNPHTAVTSGGNPHESVSCVGCHEVGGPLGRVTTQVIPRGLHFLDAKIDFQASGDYGRPRSAACSQCHASGIRDVTLNKDRGLRMSHAEPLKAGASCLDCHRPKDGVVGQHNAGMNPCLRCHDSRQASAKCVTCHDSKASTAARARTAEFSAVQVTQITCGGCHNEKRECDSCHGVRMPHTAKFMQYAHARAGAVDFWHNGGRGCSKCHTAQRRPCTRCHTPFLGRAHPTSLAVGHRKAQEVGCNKCHHTMAFLPNRNFCTDVCHSPEAIAGSPR